MLNLNNKGIALFIVLMTVIISIILANIVLGLMLTQNRLSHHTVSRIQAYYAGLAGVRYANEMIRTGVWTAANSKLPTDSGSPVGTGSNTKCYLLCPTSSCTSSTCTVLTADSALPPTINSVTITVGESQSKAITSNGSTTYTRLIKSTVNYTPNL